MRAIVKPIIDESVRELCYRKYPGHPNGCPNYGLRDTCPPHAPLLGKVLDLNKTIYAIWVDFNLAQQRAKMLSRHPNWSLRQQECCLYWQGGVRKQLKLEAELFCMEQLLRDSSKKVLSVFYVPEAMGVNITQTLIQVCIELEWPPVNIVRKVALVGTKL